MTSEFTITTLLPCSSSATHIGEQGKPPIITLGKFTPDLLFNFENGTYSYFSFKEVKPEKEVVKVVGGLQDGHVQTWYRLNCAKVNASFTAFMKLAAPTGLTLGGSRKSNCSSWGPRRVQNPSPTGSC
jgi:hypothetical protein